MTRGSGGAGADGNLMALGASSARPRRLLGAYGKTNVFLTFFPKIAFPCSVALKSCGATSKNPSPKKHGKAFILNTLERFLGTLFWRPFFGRSALMQRGARFFWRRSALMQRGARFWIVDFFSCSLGGRMWDQRGRPKHV